MACIATSGLSLQAYIPSTGVPVGCTITQGRCPKRELHGYASATGLDFDLAAFTIPSSTFVTVKRGITRVTHTRRSRLISVRPCCMHVALSPILRVRTALFSVSSAHPAPILFPNRVSLIWYAAKYCWDGTGEFILLLSALCKHESRFTNKPRGD